MSVVVGIGRFLYDFIIGDDWKIAAAVITALAIGLAMLSGGVSVAAAVIGTAGLLAAAFTVAMLIDVHRTGD